MKELSQHCTKTPLALLKITCFPYHHGGSAVCATHFNVGKMTLNTNQTTLRNLKLTINYKPSGSLKDLGERETGQVNEL